MEEATISEILDSLNPDANAKFKEVIYEELLYLFGIMNRDPEDFFVFQKIDEDPNCKDTQLWAQNKVTKAIIEVLTEIVENNS